MDQVICKICQKTNHTPKRKVILVATFAQMFFAKNALFDIEKAHIVLSWHDVYVQNTIPTCIMELHGLTDIVNLQTLYIESICRDNNALSFDMFSSQKAQEELLAQL